VSILSLKKCQFNIRERVHHKRYGGRIMMKEIKLIDIKEEILSENKGLADKMRELFNSKKVLFINVMGSPGAGKTSLILKTIESIGSKYKIAVIEADIDSMIDSESVSKLNVPTVQLHTGGFCHVDANMVEKAIESLPLDELDLIILENVGNLVCPAESDTGAFKNVTILSVPEGDDKPLKYPLMFSVSDVLVINKLDYLHLADFNADRVIQNVRALNEKIQVFQLSCRTSDGLGTWISWLDKEISTGMGGPVS
jgi:hydrogenase nickel incorporation protein HypB